MGSSGSGHSTPQSLKSLGASGSLASRFSERSKTVGVRAPTTEFHKSVLPPLQSTRLDQTDAASRVNVREGLVPQLRAMRRALGPFVADTLWRRRELVRP